MWLDFALDGHVFSITLWNLFDKQWKRFSELNSYNYTDNGNKWVETREGKLANVKD